MSSKRYYYKNQEIKLTTGEELSVSSGGATYIRDETGACRSLDSMWGAAGHNLYVCLPDDRLVKLHRDKDGLHEQSMNKHSWTMDAMRLRQVLAKRQELMSV